MLKKYLKEEYKNNPNFYEVIIKDNEIIKRSVAQKELDRYGTRITSLGVEGTEISCGVQQVYEINDFYKKIEQYFKKEYLSIIFKKCLKNIKNYNAAFLIMSTTKSEEALVKILDELCLVKSFFRKNPNSGNLIKVWIF
jgi:hypothetical protein